MPIAHYPIDATRLAVLLQRYQSHTCQSVSYGTVRDFSDSVAHLPELTCQGDLKDVQRPWIFKSIVSQIPRGGRVLEIGAGDPHVAHWLDQAGYEVTIVDPYDGSGNGPTDLAYYQQHFPELKIRREAFAETLTGLEPGSFECVYSISALEHIPHDKLLGVIAGIRRYQKAGLPTIHAVDNVFRGRREEWHRQTLEILNHGFGLQPAQLAEMLKTAADDPETYFLSAESHSRWRAGMDYNSFPMRRCISVQFCTRLP